MTKSSKQGTAKTPADSAGTESAADSAQAGQDDQAAQEAATPAAEAEAADLDETKRKFREALERKHQARGEGQGKGGKDAGKISGAHGPAASRRNFRRKSG